MVSYDRLILLNTGNCPVPGAARSSRGLQVVLDRIPGALCRVPSAFVERAADPTVLVLLWNNMGQDLICLAVAWSRSSAGIGKL